MRSNDLPGNSQPETRAPGIPAARIIQPDEALKDPVAIDLWDTGSIIVHHEFYVGSDLAQRDGHAVVGVAPGVLEEIPYHPGQVVGVPDDAGSGDSRCVNRYPASGASPRRLVQNDVVQIDMCDRVARPGRSRAADERAKAGEKAGEKAAWQEGPADGDGNPGQIGGSGIEQVDRFPPGGELVLETEEPGRLVHGATVVIDPTQDLAEPTLAVGRAGQGDATEAGCETPDRVDPPGCGRSAAPWRPGGTPARGA